MSLTESPSTEKSAATKAASLPIARSPSLASLISSALGDLRAEEMTISRATDSFSARTRTTATIVTSNCILGAWLACLSWLLAWRRNPTAGFSDRRGGALISSRRRSAGLPRDRPGGFPGCYHETVSTILRQMFHGGSGESPLPATSMTRAPCRKDGGTRPALAGGARHTVDIPSRLLQNLDKLGSDVKNNWRGLVVRRAPTSLGEPVESGRDQ